MDGLLRLNLNLMGDLSLVAAPLAAPDKIPNANNIVFVSLPT